MSEITKRELLKHIDEVGMYILD